MKDDIVYQELLDSIYDSFKALGEPAGLPKTDYPGIPTSGDHEKEYTTHRSLDIYSTRLQQPIENYVREIDETGVPSDTGEDEEEYTITEIGRIYELKKIFSRLISLQSFLNEYNEELLIKMSSYTNEAINLFKIIINNIDKYLDQIDEIIVIYYEYIDVSYKLLGKFYEKEKDKGDD